MNRIVVGIDDSENALHALQWAIDLAQRLDKPTSDDPTPTIHAVSVLPEPRQGALGLPSGVPPDVQEDRREQHLADFERTIDRAGSQVQARIETHVIEGAPAQQLLDFVKAEDVLVVGRSALGPVGGLVMGSVARRCATEAPCPVVVVPTRPEHSETDEGPAGT